MTTNFVAILFISDLVKIWFWLYRVANKCENKTEMYEEQARKFHFMHEHLSLPCIQLPSFTNK